MPLTHHPHGISSFGVPVIGGGRYGWKDAASVYFVDGTGGDDAYDGTTPELAVATVQRGLALMNAYDVLYIVENAFVDTDPTYYQGATANHTIAVANTGVAIVGVSHAGQLGYPMTPYLMGYTATETPVFTVNAPLVAIENLHFSGGWANANTTTAGIYAPNSTGTSSAVPQAISIHNCSFEDFEGATPASATSYPGAGVSIIGTWYSVVNHCRFRNCVVGVQIGSSASTMVATVIENNIFFADATTDVNADINSYMQGTTDICIKNNYFAHALPTYAGGSAVRYIAFAGGGQEKGLVTDNYCGHTSTLSAGAAGSGILAPANMGFGKNYCFHALMADAT